MGTRRAAPLSTIPPELHALAEQAKAYTDSLPKVIIGGPADAAAYLLPEVLERESEALFVLMLNTRNRVTGKTVVYEGSVNTSLVRLSEVFREAVRRNACSIIVAHNHPSGDPSPSPEDVGLTRALVQAGKLLDVQVLDHLVLAGGHAVSLKARGLGFED